MVRNIIYEIQDLDMGATVEIAANRIMDILEGAATEQWYEDMARRAASPKVVCPEDPYDEWKQHVNRYMRELEEDEDRIKEDIKKTRPLRGEQGDALLTLAELSKKYGVDDETFKTVIEALNAESEFEKDILSDMKWIEGKSSGQKEGSRAGRIVTKSEDYPGDCTNCYFFDEEGACVKEDEDVPELQCCSFGFIYVEEL